MPLDSAPDTAVNTPGTSPKLMLSLVIPVYNESESLAQLHQEIRAVVDQHAYTTEIVLIDDGSRDGSWQQIQALAKKDACVRGIRFRRNFGKSAALAAGFAAARGEIVMTLDADLQDDPQEIPRFIATIHSGKDVVSGFKQIRHDPWHKVFPSRVFNALVSWLTGVVLHDHNCGMKAYRGDALAHVQLYGERHRFIPVLLAAQGYTVGELVIQHRARKFGVSKFGVERFIKGFLDLLTIKFLTGYGQRPLHLLGALGLGCFVFGLLVLVYLALEWGYLRFLLNVDPQFAGRPAMLYGVALVLLGGQLLSLGLLAEMITAHHSKDVIPYSISERTDTTR